MYRMTISSQYYWTHKIDKGSIDPNRVRYSLTLRTVGKYHNSVLIIGDSNTRHVYFYGKPGKRTVLGKEITGKRYPAYHVDKIDATQCIGYRNIIYHVGINDLKDHPNAMNGQVNVSTVFMNWLEKLISIHKLCPYSTFFVSPILPTKVRVLNNRAVRFSKLISGCINPFWDFLDFNNFLDTRTDLLDDSFGCHMNLNNGKRDKIHLGSYRISKLALIFRDVILPRKRYQSHATTAKGKFRNSMLRTDNNGVRRGTIGKGNASNISASATSTADVP